MSGINSSMLGPDGKVQVWDIEKKKFKRIMPIDAKEQLAAGVVSVTQPSGKSKGKAKKDDRPDYDFGAHNVDELRIFAELGGVDPNQKRGELVDELNGSTFRPTAEDLNSLAEAMVIKSQTPATE